MSKEELYFPENLQDHSILKIVVEKSKGKAIEIVRDFSYKLPKKSIQTYVINS
jgi:hypothetical protein